MKALLFSNGKHTQRRWRTAQYWPVLTLIQWLKALEHPPPINAMIYKDNLGYLDTLMPQNASNNSLGLNTKY
jgi:hypothetical protein